MVSVVQMNKKRFADFLFWFIICQVILFRYLNIHETMNKIIVVLVMLFWGWDWLCKIKKTSIVVSRLQGIITIFLCLTLLNGFLYGINDIYISNLLMILYVLIESQFLAWYVWRYGDQVLQWMIQLKYAINLYYLINIGVMFIQIRDTSFLVGFSDFEAGATHDLVCGLLGYQVMGATTLFMVFVTIYNIALLPRVKTKHGKILFACYIGITALLMVVISVRCDNVGYVLLLMISWLLVFVSKYSLRLKITWERCFALFTSLLCCLVMMLLFLPELKDVLYEKVFYKIVGLIQYATSGASVAHGSLERVALLVYGLRHTDGWFLGEGLASHGLYAPGTYGFVHFGNANIGAVVCLAGIWYYIILTTAHSYRIIKCVQAAAGRGKKLYYAFAISAYYVLVTLYTLPFTDISVGLCLQIVMIGIWFNEKLNRCGG